MTSNTHYSYNVKTTSLRKRYLILSISSAAICIFLGLLALTIKTEAAQFVLAATSGAFLASALVSAVFWDTERY